MTMKTRKGLDDDHLTYLDAGRIAQECGVAAIALHGRTVEQAYSGEADWDAIAALVDHVDIPVSATATSGRPPTRSGWSSRPAPRASSSARLPGAPVAVPRPGGRLPRAGRRHPPARLGEVRR